MSDRKSPTRMCSYLSSFLRARSDQSLRNLVELPQWVERSIERKLIAGKLVLVSAVCPDYERSGGVFTYRGLGSGVPYIAACHIEIVAAISKILERDGISLVYHITLADTEFDLPLVLRHMTGGDPKVFLDRCEESCSALRDMAERAGIQVGYCKRFLAMFPNWYSIYKEARTIAWIEVDHDSSVRADLDLSAFKRKMLYDAMTGLNTETLYAKYRDMVPVSGTSYSREMVVRQWAQYMTWGVCAEEQFGSFVMINHSTPNLTRVNHPALRNGKERIPILQLKLTTMPGE